VRFAVNRRCDLLHLRFSVRHGIATVYTKHAISGCDLLCDIVLRFAVRFGA
jgi:hypothetical protein